MTKDKGEPIGFQTVEEWHREMAVRVAKWIGWKLFILIAIIIVL